ncbi:hypothetical protein STRCR_0164 [Streptococcus criceti HS-6]|uniref:Uncharacterized protein n=1 Tax=Streptococcus criceti HS-6 TaxID=873449 RepID=G5JNC7_STRCG|nr:hypothetical protein STRCR_0164 [Streptococcus criceti HS-6]
MVQLYNDTKRNYAIVTSHKKVSVQRRTIMKRSELKSRAKQKLSGNWKWAIGVVAIV